VRPLCLKSGRAGTKTASSHAGLVPLKSAIGVVCGLQFYDLPINLARDIYSSVTALRPRRPAIHRARPRRVSSTSATASAERKASVSTHYQRYQNTPEDEPGINLWPTRVTRDCEPKSPGTQCEPKFVSGTHRESAALIGGSSGQELLPPGH
jgi:hypothetical protein